MASGVRVLGRAAELAQAEPFLDALDQGSAALVIEGEAGAGKTTLLVAVLERARACGYRVLEARPTEPESMLSYTALSDLLADVFDSARPYLPSPQEHALGVALLRDRADAALDARATAMGVVGVLGAFAADTPVVVAVDDAQWLDAASERSLTFAARRLPRRVGLVVTRRGDGTASLPLGLDGLLASGRVDRMVVGPLSLSVLHQLIAERLGSPLPRPVLVRVAAASGGNPFFALEIARAIDSNSADRSLADPLPVPESLYALLTERIGDLSADARAVLLVASALSHPTANAIAMALEDRIDVDGVLAEAEDAGVLVFERGRVRFAHPLLSSAVYGSASETRRRRLHERLARLCDDPEERAGHLASSVIEADPVTAAEIEDGAGQAALRGAQDRAAELFDVSYRLTLSGDRNDQARRLLRQAGALNAIGDFGEAGALAERARELATTAELRVEALSLLAGLAWFGGAPAVASAHLRDALEIAGDDADLAGPIHAKLVRFSMTLDAASAAEHAEIAVRLLDERRDRSAFAHVLLDQFFSAVHLDQEASPAVLERGLALESQSIAAGSSAPHPYPLIWFHCADQLANARERFAMEEGWYRARGDEVWLADRRSHLAVAELRAGHLERASSLVHDACDALTQVDARGPFSMVFEKRALVDAHFGRVDAARSALTPLVERFESVDQPWWAALTLSTLAFAEFVAGEHAAVDRALTRMRRHADAVGAAEIPTDRSEALHVESLLALGDVERARETLARLERRAKALPRRWTQIALPRAHALMRAHDDDVDGAIEVLLGIDWMTSTELPFERAWTVLIQGGLLRRQRQKRAAAAAFEEATTLFEHMGATFWVGRARSALERVGLRPSAPHELTGSERQVAELVSTGLTNREVASALFMSTKTVEATLGRVYRKLHVRSRVELTARLATDRGDPLIPGQ